MIMPLEPLPWLHLVFPVFVLFKIPAHDLPDLVHHGVGVQAEYIPFVVPHDQGRISCGFQGPGGAFLSRAQAPPFDGTGAAAVAEIPGIPVNALVKT